MTAQIKAAVREVIVDEGVMPPDVLGFAVVSTRPDAYTPTILNVHVTLPDPELCQRYFGGRSLKFDIEPPYDYDQISSNCAKAYRTLKRRVAIKDAGGVHSRQRPIVETERRPAAAKISDEQESQPQTKRKRKRRRNRRKKNRGQDV